LTHAQENQDTEDTAVAPKNTLEVMGFSVLDEEVSDSLSIDNDSLALKKEKIISRRDSLLFLNFWLPKPGVLKDVVLDTLTKIPDSITKNLTPRFKYMKEIGLEHDTRFISNSLIIQLLDSFSFERTQYNLRLRKAREIAQKPIKEMEEVTIEDYKIYYSDGTVKHVDTTLTINKDYHFNYLRKDYFELLPFANSGETFNKLGYDFQDQKIIPDIGARAKHYGYMEKDEIGYYEVPSPLTELFFKTVFEQGQLVDALITVNTAPRLNITLAHKAFRSLGNYINTLGGGTNLRFTSQYTTKNYRYRQRSHFAAQRIENQANGGLDSLSVYYFEKAIDELEYDGFLDRSRLTNNANTNNTLIGRRYYLDHQYDATLGGNDKMKNYEKPKVLTIGHKFNFEGKHFDYNNSSSNSFFGTVSGTSSFATRNSLDVMDNEIYAIYHEKNLGELKAGLRLIQWNYSIKLPENTKDPDNPFDYGSNPTEIKANQLALSAYWKKTFLKFDFKAEGYFSAVKEYSSQFISGALSRDFENGISTKAKLSLRSQAPNFNFFLHRSNFLEYDWYNPSLKNQLTNSLNFSFVHPKWGRLEGQYELLNNYTYFKNLKPVLRKFSYYSAISKKEEELLVAPEQYEGTIGYLKLRFSQQLDFWKFTWAITAQYQQVSNDGDIDFKPLNVPEWNLRSSFLFSSQLFNKALYLQTGVTAQYFTDFYADRYSPHLGEFVSQNHTEIGKFPRLDFFINAKIQQTRLFLKYEHFNSDMTGYNFYSAPFTPYRDSSIRFGLVWNFFQ
tara:strand:+ start:186 stop:2537 length:2352 start_codon:yes stop_codon:yes gene_type:complete